MPAVAHRHEGIWTGEIAAKTGLEEGPQIALDVDGAGEIRFEEPDMTEQQSVPLGTPSVEHDRRFRLAAASLDTGTVGKHKTHPAVLCQRAGTEETSQQGTGNHSCFPSGFLQRSRTATTDGDTPGQGAAARSSSPSPTVPRPRKHESAGPPRDLRHSRTQPFARPVYVVFCSQGGQTITSCLNCLLQHDQLHKRSPGYWLRPL